MPFCQTIGPIRTVIPYPPGGFTDVMARLHGEPLGKALGPSVIFESKPGANGMIGWRPSRA